ncbi:MAG: helix-turn-helix transcriptional regulator [Hungatella sp.]|nr:helix-turn-helix transcriptional regulator [Hungatella sp.]
MDISHRIKQLRIEQEYTQKQLADKIGLTPKMISFYENGERVPPIDILLKLVQIFNVSSDYLLGNTDERHPAKDYEWRYPSVSNRLGGILANYRRTNNLSQKDFSQKLNINEKLYNDIECGKYEPTLQLLKKISDITEFDINYLTGATDHTSIPSDETFNLYGKEVPIFYTFGDSHFKTRLEELCLQNSINQSNVEKRLGLSKQDFLDIQWNRMPTLSELLKLSYAFCVSLDYLIGKTDTRLSNLSNDELELILNYRDCLPHFKENISKRAKDLSIESIQEKIGHSVAADESLKQTGTDSPK